MYAILIFLDIKWHNLKNHQLQFFSDNQPTVHTLTSKSSSSKQLMTIIRIIMLICLHHNIYFIILHVRGKANIHTDLLSRIKLDAAGRRLRGFAVLDTPRAMPGPYHQHTEVLGSLAHQPATHGVYDRAWELFNRFLMPYNKTLHALCDLDLVEFISLLSLIPLAGTTIRTYILGVGHHLKIRLLPDFQSSFIISLVLKGATSLEASGDVRIPISLKMWHGMFMSCPGQK